MGSVKKPLPVELWEDHEAWERYGKTDLRWVFNKLEVALRQGLHAGPGGTAPHHNGLYISRPVFNIYGMGIGAKQFSYDENTMKDGMIQHLEVPPGHFWCEWLPGPHRSIDYHHYDDGSWRVESVWEGVHYSDTNLVKFRSWTRLSNRAAPDIYDLPLDEVSEFGVPYINIEMRGDYITEIHLRPGDALFNRYPVGTQLIPVWEGMEHPKGEWIPDVDLDMSRYTANGHLTDIRDGFIVIRGEHQ
jgi:hypothetical protein